MEERRPGNAHRVLVTGGAGFIGSHAVDALRARGSAVRVLDDFSSGKRENVPADTDVVEGSVTDPDTVRSALRDVDVVVHLAAIASVQTSIALPLEAHDVNLTGTLHLLEAMRDLGVPRIVYASTAAVYGNVERPRHRETDAVAPATPYAISKYAGERYLAAYASQYGIDARSLRFFNVYGPRQDPSSPYSGVISIFAERLRHQMPLTIYGDGHQTRDFVYVEDVAQVLAQHVDDPAPSAPSPMHVCSGSETSLHDLIGHLKAQYGYEASITYDDERPGDIRRSVGDPSTLLSWADLNDWTPLGFGLARTFDSTRETTETRQDNGRR